jgi:antitoxin component YwqK of YwqJK toxin-antitoxin module
MADTWHTWHENGNLLAELDYASDDLTNPDTNPKISPTKKKSVIENTDFTGLKHGKFLRHYSNGKINDSGRYINDKKEGLWKIWFENGQLEAMGNFSNDSLQGEWTWYYDNGAMAAKENYRDNKLVSLQCFDDKGNYTGDYCSILKPLVRRG